MTTKFIGDGEKIITTVLLNGERIHIRVHTHANAQNVFDAIVQYIGLTEVVYFGLMIIKDGEQQFLDLDEKLSRLAKYAPHLWKDDNSCNSSLVFTVFFRVKYYVENICLLQEQQTRHQYYLQLRKDVLENSIRIHEDTSMVLASYALQAELGDYDRNVHGIDYFVPQHYLPARAIAKLAIPYIKNTLPAMHQSLRGLSESQAEIEFLKEAQKLSEYGILFHRVYKKEYSKQIPHNIGICLRGLVIYEETGPVRNSLCKYPWSKVKKMSFKRSKFIVEADTPNVKYSKLTFYTASYKRSSYLLKISSSFFNFQMKMGSKIAMLPEHVMQNTVPVVPLMRNESGVHLKSGLTSEPNSHSVVSARQSGSGKDSPKSKSQIKPEVKQYTLDLIKKDGSFGFSIVGGIELGGIFVKDITPGGPAALSRQINAGDRIVQINKVSFENVTRREAINTLRNAADKSKFIIESFGQNLVIEADASLNTPLVMSTQSITMTQPQIPLVQTERESEFIRVNLVKHNNTFGIGFTGGPELGGVYVKSLLPHSSAEIDGRIAVGDRLVEIDQVNVENFTRKKIQEFLKQVQGHVCIVVERYKQLPSAGGLMYIDREKVLRSSPNFTSITLSKKNDSLGFSITGGLDLGGIFVKYLNPNGPAACDKRLEIGDRVVGVNDISLETVSRQKALEILRNATSPVNLIIEKCMSPGGPLSKITDSGIKLLRSDSIKSLPTQAMHRQNIGTQSRNLNFSMQHLANAISGVPSSIINQLNTHDMNANYTASSKFNPPIKSSKEVFVVDLTKKNGCFGISLTGGVEVGGIFVKALKPGTHPSIQKGDRVIEINARRMDGLSGAEAVNWLKLSGNTATFILERYLYQPHESPQLSRLSSLDGDVLQLQLQRKNNSFGLCLVDGPEHCGIFVKSMLQGGSAELDGRVDRGDRLLEINGISLEGLNKHQVYDLLKQTTGILHLLVEKYHANENLRIFDKDMYSVELRKGDAGLGLSITGGPELGGIFVKGLLPGGAADASKKIQKGDRLVEVNSISLNGLSKQQAWEVFQKAPINMNLLMEKNAAFDNIIIPESDYFTVELHKKNNGYGLNLTGGPEIDGVYVKQVQKDSAADQDGRIRKGDRLITINGRNVESSTRQKCTEMLKLTQDIAVLLLERCVVGEDLPPLDTVLTVVKLTKSISGFGISLTGGPEIGGIFVKALMPGGCAEKDAHIQIGDRLVEINGQSFDNLSRQQATDLLKNSASTATFILERYKTRIKEQPIVYPSMTPDSTVSKPLLRPMERQSPQISEQHFAFPLYNGAAPSVPPRHNANGGPGRESAFKRFEQQQRVSSDSTQHNSYQLNNHGNTVSNRLPSYMQRQNSMERKENVDNYVSQDDQGESNQVYGSQNTHFTIPEIADQVAPFSVVEGPLRMYVTPHNDIVDDSPQRFIQKLSKSVVPQNADNALIASRVPLGPISSAIFGGNRDGRNVHELLDPEITREHIDGARFVIDSNGDSLSAEGYIRNSVEQRENNNAYEHPRNRITSNISCNQVAANVLVNTNSNTSVSKNISYKSIKPSVDVILQATKIENKGFQPANISDEYKNQQAYLPSPKPQSSPFNQDAKTTDKIYTKPLDKQETMANKNVNSSIKPAGLQWISFNSSGSNDQSVKNSVSSALRGADVNTSPSSPINKRNLPKNEPATSRSPQPLSCDIPVPFASRFNNTTKNKLPGDFVFEVTLYKGRNGFGMNLVGGGSADNPLKIKKIASGTSADESGQIRVGDILLEVNGKKLDHLVAKDVISMLRGCQSEVQLLVKRCASQDQISSLSSSSVGL